MSLSGVFYPNSVRYLHRCCESRSRRRFQVPEKVSGPRFSCRQRPCLQGRETGGAKQESSRPGQAEPAMRKVAKNPSVTLSKRIPPRRPRATGEFSGPTRCDGWTSQALNVTLRHMGEVHPSVVPGRDDAESVLNRADGHAAGGLSLFQREGQVWFLRGDSFSFSERRVRREARFPPALFPALPRRWSGRAGMRRAAQVIKSRGRCGLLSWSQGARAAPGQPLGSEA